MLFELSRFQTSRFSAEANWMYSGNLHWDYTPDVVTLQLPQFFFPVRAVSAPQFSHTILGKLEFLKG